MIKEKVIHLRLAGGLGNQIFQFAFSIYIAKKNNYTSIYLDTNGLSKYKAQHNEYLSKYFNFDKTSLKINHKNSLILKYRLAKMFAIKSKFCPFISDKNRNFAINNKNKKLYIDGYFIWSLSQEEFDETIKILKSFMIDSKVEVDNSKCVVHIRGGDFVELGWNALTPASYYLDAMKNMVLNYQIKSFIIITDDIKYSEDLLKDCQYEYEIQSNDMLTDFFTIANAQMKIIGGSSFAIWAAALGYDGNNGMLIAPPRNVLLPNQMKMTLK